MSITVVKAGLCDTIQDNGRFGYAAFGINSSGVMDQLAMMTANALVGNELATAVIEMHFPAAFFRFDVDVLIALSGADFNAVITEQDGQVTPLDTNKSAFVKTGSVLSFRAKIDGERCYFAVHSGFDLPVWMGSNSTNLAAKQGGFHGRKLMKGDRIAMCKKMSSGFDQTQVFPWQAGVHPWYHDAPTINVLPGPEWNQMQPISQKHFLSKGFTVSAHSDRMGIRLEGLPLAKNDDTEMVSSGTSFGTIQLLPNGQLIILAADHPTTGGYPRIANIISAHLPKLVQATAGSSIHFGVTDITNAEKMLLMQRKEMQQLRSAVRLRLSHL